MYKPENEELISDIPQAADVPDCGHCQEPDSSEADHEELEDTAPEEDVD